MALKATSPIAPPGKQTPGAAPSDGTGAPPDITLPPTGTSTADKYGAGVNGSDVVGANQLGAIGQELGLQGDVTVDQIVQAFDDAPAEVRAQIQGLLWQGRFYSSSYNPIPGGIPKKEDEAALANAMTIVSHASTYTIDDYLNASSQAGLEQGVAAKGGVTTKQLGLGKAPIKLTNPIEVAAIVNQTAQQLTGMDATQAQIDAITKSLHTKELAAGQADFQQYVEQQEAQYEFWGGGIAGGAAPGAATGTSPVTLPSSPGAPLPASSGMVGPTGAGAGQTVMPVANGATHMNWAGQQVMSDGTVVVPPGQSAGAAPPANAIKLNDGTILIPPKEQVTTSAPSASALAAQAIRGTPQYTAYNFLQAANAIEQMVKGSGR